MMVAMVKELLKHLFKRPFTVKYPFEKRVPVKGMRGRPVWAMERCIGCELCFKDCPSGAIEMIGTGLEAEFNHYVDRCIFCGRCEEVCPTKTITLTEEFELAGSNRAEMMIAFKRTQPAVP